ncbi:MAG: sugar transferase [Candidatus Kapabacteria bacterium]|nr:sugar transferase [Ignavibacteriota bacterium]MCW5884236.1 sugar transferase [Candidatus Kapabacteria bacterium]
MSFANANKIITDKFPDIQIQRKPYFKSRHSQALIQSIFDVAAIIISYLFYYYIRFESGIYYTLVKPGIIEILMGTSIFLIFWLIVFFFSGMYKNWYERSPFDEIWAVMKVTLIGCAIIIFAVKYDSDASPRQLYLIYFLLMSVTIIAGRTVARNIEKSLRRRRILHIPVLIVGTPKRAYDFFLKTEESTSWGFKSMGIVLIDDFEKFDDNFEYDKLAPYVIGNMNELEYFVDTLKPEEVLICSDKTNHEILLSVVSICSDRNLRVRIEPDLYDIFTGQTKTQNLYGIPLIEISTQLMKPWQEAIKRIFDITFSLIVLIGGLPLWILVAIGVKIDSKGPFMYVQPRVGKDGKIFNIYKFRSMTFEPERNEQKWTVVNDPRVTKFGKFIRKTHLDEIPQFFNVLIGDMSVVGPRPEQPKFVEEFAKEIPHYKRRLKVRPGITGWWQVQSAGYTLSLDEIKYRIKGDFYYIENMSLKLDVEIVIRTVWCVVTGHGQA